MKKKILALMLTVCMIVPCMASLTACGGDGATFGHTHTWAEKYTYNATQHWKKCVDCDETTDKENHELTTGSALFAVTSIVRKLRRRNKQCPNIFPV